MGRTACTEPQCLYKGALYLTFFIEKKNVKFPLRIAHISFSPPSQRDAVIWNGISRKQRQLLVSLRVCKIRTPRIGTGPGAHPASCKMGTGSFPGVSAAGACC